MGAIPVKERKVSAKKNQIEVLNHMVTGFEDLNVEVPDVLFVAIQKKKARTAITNLINFLKDNKLLATAGIFRESPEKKRLTF